MSDPTAPTSACASAEELGSRIFAWRRGFNAMYVVDFGVRLGLFGSLAESGVATADELAGRLHLHPPYVRVWCTTAHSLALLDSDDGRQYRLAPFVDVVLADPRHPRHLGGYVHLGTQFASDDFRAALAAFRTGETVPFQGRSAAFADTVASALAGVNLMVARKVLPGIAGAAERLHAGGSLLEVGCGAGRLQLQLAKAFPNARCTGIDIDPTGLAAARQAIASAGLSSRVSILEGDVASAVEPGSFDVVLMVEVLHEIAADIRPQVVGACGRALRPGGWLVIVDETYPETAAEARQAEFRFPLQTGLEEMTWGNVVPTRAEQERLLNDAGFTGEVQRSVFGEGFTLLVAQR